MTYADDLIRDARRRSMATTNALDSALLQRLADALERSVLGIEVLPREMTGRIVAGRLHDPDEAIFVAEHRAGEHDPYRNAFCILCRGGVPLPENAR